MQFIKQWFLKLISKVKSSTFTFAKKSKHHSLHKQDASSEFINQDHTCPRCNESLKSGVTTCSRCGKSTI